MRKKLIDILKVMSVFQILMQKHFKNFEVSLKISKAAKELESHRSFYVAEEKKLVDEYASKDEKGETIIINGNQVKFDNEENSIKFNEEVMKLQSTEVDLFEPIEISLSDIKTGEAFLSPMEIINLEGFVKFIDPSDKGGEA